MNQHHKIEIFSANYPLCKHVIDTIEIGRCKSCSTIIYDINNVNKEIRLKMKNYGVLAVPATIIDGKIKVVGIPDFPWICGEDFYKKMKKEYPLKRD